MCDTVDGWMILWVYLCKHVRYLKIMKMDNIMQREYVERKSDEG